jgi:hypothetical protein
MSNVRPHKNYLALNAAVGDAGFEIEDLLRLDRSTDGASDFSPEVIPALGCAR